MEQNTQTTGTNTVTATPQVPEAASPAPATTTASPQSLADRMAEYKNTPGLFDDSPRKPSQPETPPTPPEPTGTPEEMLEKVLKDEAIPADIKSENGKANWKALREQAKAKKEYEAKWKAANEELEKIKTAPKVAGDPAEVEALKRERDALSEQLKEANVERHPQFRAYFDGKTNAVLAEAKKVGGAQFGDKLASLLKQPDSDIRTAQIDEIVSQLSPFNQMRVAKVVSDSDAIQAERATEIEKAKGSFEKIQLQEREKAQRAQQEQKATLDKALEQQLIEAQKSIPVFQKRDGDAKWNEQVDALTKSVKNAYSGNLTVEDLARGATWANAAPLLLQDSLAKAQQIDALQKELASLKAAKPKPGAGDSPNQSPAMPAAMSPVERIVWQAQQAGAIR